MSGDKKLDDALGGLDWDEALDEWEKNTFIPQVTDETATRDPGAVEDDLAITEARATHSPADDEAGTLVAKSPRSQAPQASPQPGPPSAPQAAPMSRPHAGSASGPASGPLSGPVSAPQSSPFRDPPSGPPRPGAAKSKGGLGQLFSRKSSIPGPLPGVPGRRGSTPPPLGDDPFSSPRAGRGDEETEVFTSAGPGSRSFATSDESAVAIEEGEPPVEHPADDNEPTGWFRRSSAPPAGTGTLTGVGAVPPIEPLDPVGVQGAPAAPAGPLAPPRARVNEDSVTMRIDAPSRPPPEETAADLDDAETGSSVDDALVVPEGMDADLARALRESARWLTDEGRATDETDERLRAHLAASEIWSLLGDATHARTSAEDAHAAAPGHALAARQRRQTGPADDDFRMVCLREEAEAAETPAARAAAQLLIADMARVLGDTEGAVESLRRACSYDPADVRGPAALAAYALSRNDHTSPFLTIEVTELSELSVAVERALETREVDRKARAPEKPTPNHHFYRAKVAYREHARNGVMEALAEMIGVPELTNAATWLGAAVGATDTPTRKRAAQLLVNLAATGDVEARASLAMRGAELSDKEVVARAIGEDGALSADDRLSLIGLSLLDATSFAPTESRPIESAIAGAIARRPELSGAVAGGALGAPVRLARALARKASAEEQDAALNAARSDVSAKPIALEFAMRAGRLTDVAETLVDWASAGKDGHEAGGGALGPALVAGLLAERAGDKERAAVAYNSARAFAPGSDGLVRIAGAVDEGFDVAFAMDGASEQATSSAAACIMRLEAAERTRMAGGDPREMLARAHQADASLGIASFLLQRAARRRGDAEDVVHWLAERAKSATDPLEAAIEAVREALLLADRDPDGSREKLEAAHAVRPNDFTLRELLERLSPQASAACAEWRVRHAANLVGPARATRLVEAAFLAEGSDARRYAKDAAASGDLLARALLEHMELETGEVSRLVEHLLLDARSASDVVGRREAYERLAEIELHIKREGASADVWHKAILDREPLHLPSLRALEHFYLGSGADAELEPIAEKIAYALGGTPGGECAAHAQLAVRLKLRGGIVDWEGTRSLVELAAQQPEPALWALRAKNAHARVAKSAQALLETATALAERTTRPGEVSALMRRASEAALELNREKKSREFLERAATEDAGDCVTWGLLADARERAQDARGSAEACESLARTSNVQTHQLLAWYDAAKLWLDAVNEPDRGIAALEQAAHLDVAFEDVFARLSAQYTARRNDAELAALLARRLERATDPDERVTLEVDRARALAEIGDLEASAIALRKALEARPDHTTALATYADLCERTGNYAEAEQAWVRLARLLSTPEEQRVVYERLGVLYSQYAVNLARAEVAFKEVLKRAPGNVPTLERLAEVYRQKNDAPHAAETMQELVALAEDEHTRLARIIALAEIHENVGHELRKAEQVLEGARKEFPTSVVALRAMAEFYARQKQIPAMHILLDRAAGDARRAFAGGRLVTSLFQILAAAYELRGKKDAANVVAATLAALEGSPAKIRGAEMRAFDPRLDDLLAPEVLSPGLRTLLSQAGDALDLAIPVDLRTLRANSLSQSSPVFSMANAIASSMGISGLNVLVSPQLAKTCIPCGSNPPMILVGESFIQAQNDRAKAFLLSRGLRTVRARASALVRAQPQELGVLLLGWLSAFNPGWKPPGVNPQALAEAMRRIQPVMPRNHDPQLSTLALEIAASLGSQMSQVGPAALAWANRGALLAIGDPTAAVEAIAWTTGLDKAPQAQEERAAWVTRTVEARELLVFSVSDAYTEARTRLGLDR